MTKTILHPIKTLFAAADERDWRKAMSVMNDEVLLDYSSMSGNPETLLTPKQITDIWAAFLPGFDKTHHQLSGFKVNEHDTTTVVVNLNGKAEHWIESACWVVEGTYDVALLQQNKRWLITEMKFNFKRQSGNTDLPSIAIEHLKKA